MKLTDKQKKVLREEFTTTVDDYMGEVLGDLFNGTLEQPDVANALADPSTDDEANYDEVLAYGEKMMKVVSDAVLKALKELK